MIKAACLLLALTYILRAPAQIPAHQAAPPYAAPPLVIPPNTTRPRPIPPSSPLTETNFQVEVRDPNGNPIPRACVSVLETRLLVVADLSGRCLCIAPPGTRGLTLFVSAIGCLQQRLYVPLPPETAAPVVVTLLPAQSIATILRIIPCQDLLTAETPGGAAATSAAGTRGRGGCIFPW
ncbi:MAG TPA: hypothetical protein VL547_04115 [Dinghuibacter sp.]|uniref:hypothetical protein n=1 Tax=Dinghuibacter sp. TaxID=2024697 RepID=UPI002C1052CB|nr:hypothetical protein [Dinghuibacter sp.]HTJ11178.1 hypothetical protein [Dinghuibacter sp.]